MAASELVVSCKTLMDLVSCHLETNKCVPRSLARHLRSVVLLLNMKRRLPRVCRQTEREGIKTFDDKKGENAGGKGVQADGKAKASKQFDDKKRKNDEGKGKRLSCSSCGGTGAEGGKAMAFLPWWKKKSRARGKGGECGQAKMWKVEKK